MVQCSGRNVTKVATVSFFLIALSFVSFSQSRWGFSIASTEYYSADSSHSEHCFFSKTVDIATLDCSKVSERTILGEEREKTKVLSECLSKWFFTKLRASTYDGISNVSSERALISQVEKMREKGKDCTDYDVQCFFKNKKEAEKERKMFIRRARKLKAVVFEVD